MCHFNKTGLKFLNTTTILNAHIAVVFRLLVQSSLQDISVQITCRVIHMYVHTHVCPAYLLICLSNMDVPGEVVQ